MAIVYFTPKKWRNVSTHSAGKQNSIDLQAQKAGKTLDDILVKDVPG